MWARRNNSIAALAAAVLALGFAATAAADPLVPPRAVLTAGPNPADVGETVFFSGAGSGGDTGGSTVSSYEWDLDGDGVFELDTGATPGASRAYTAPTTVTTRLRVTDNEGDVAETSLSLRVNAGPRAGFIFEPSAPVANERVTFSSTSSDPDGSLPDSAYAWDFDDDGTFDDATGETVTVSFPRAGTIAVALRIVDSDGATATKTRKVSVGAARPRVLSPFPIVRLSGEVRSGGSTEIDRLSVRGPRGSKVTVKCRGDGCDFRQKSRSIKRRRVKFPEIEGRLQPGALVQVYVTQKDRIGKFTSFRIRAGAAPKRRDRCLAPDSREPISCPRS